MVSRDYELLENYEDKILLLHKNTEDMTDLLPHRN